MHLAPPPGTLRRPGPGEQCDFVVEHTPPSGCGSGSSPSTGAAPGGPVLLDMTGEPFADDGDRVLAIGGFAPSRVEREEGIFNAGELRVNE